jgi:hypothetical protein
MRAGFAMIFPMLYLALIDHEIDRPNVVNPIKHCIDCRPPSRQIIAKAIWVNRQHVDLLTRKRWEWHYSALRVLTNNCFHYLPF